MLLNVFLVLFQGPSVTAGKHKVASQRIKQLCIVDLSVAILIQHGAKQTRACLDHRAGTHSSRSGLARLLAASHHEEPVDATPARKQVQSPFLSYLTTNANFARKYASMSGLGYTLGVAFDSREDEPDDEPDDEEEPEDDDMNKYD